MLKINKGICGTFSQKHAFGLAIVKNKRLEFDVQTADTATFAQTSLSA
jgi:hypothetical protein